jgi:ketosteroid isomerase-like protein
MAMRGVLGLLAIGGLMASCPAVAQTSGSGMMSNSPEAQVRAANDAFWAAFNRCDAAAMAPAFTEDVEFYHDKTGLTATRAAVVKSMVDGPCGDPAHIRVRREAVAGSERFDPLAGGYALLTGEHRFLSSKDGGDFHHDGIARYIELWQQTDAGWRMRRVVSYDHHPERPDLHPVAVPAQQLAALAGTYGGDPSGPIIVTLAGDHLTVASGHAVFDLVPLGGDRFGVADRWLEFTFADGRLEVREEGKLVATAHRP